jgi:hypothetical protein
MRGNLGGRSQQYLYITLLLKKSKRKPRIYEAISEAEATVLK